LIDNQVYKKVGDKMKLIIKWLIISASLFLAAWLIPGIEVTGANAWLVYGVTAVILGLVNLLIRPILKFLSCGIIVLTFGLFSLVINALTLLMSSRIAENWFALGFHIESFWDAILGGLIVSVVSTILNSILIEKRNKKN